MGCAPSVTNPDDARSPLPADRAGTVTDDTEMVVAPTLAVLDVMTCVPSGNSSRVPVGSATASELTGRLVTVPAPTVPLIVATASSRVTRMRCVPPESDSWMVMVYSTPATNGRPGRFVNTADDEPPPTA